ncbi:mannosyltransferase PIG-V [Kocuria rhizophila]
MSRARDTGRRHSGDRTRKDAATADGVAPGPAAAARWDDAPCPAEAERRAGPGHPSSADDGAGGAPRAAGAVTVEDALTARRRPWRAALGGAWARSPWWLAVLALYGLSRVWGWAVFSVVGGQQGPGPWGQGPLGYLDFVATWDSDWYRTIFEHGYPSELPRDSLGTVRENPWAFYPVFPLLVRGITEVTGTGWAGTASTVSLLAGFGAALVLYRLTCTAPVMSTPRTRGGASVPALWAVAVFAFNPVAPVLQTPYAEALSLLFLLSAILCVVRGRAAGAAVFVVLQALTRPTGVALAAALGVWWLWRSVRDVRARRRAWYRCADRWLAVALLACAAALAWPVITWAVTGEPTAYTETEAAWRGSSGVVPVLPWFAQATRFLGPVAGLLAPVLLVAAAVPVLRSGPVRSALPFFVRVWLAAYGCYLLLVLNPQSSTFRLLLPWAPLAAALVRVSDSRAYRVLLVLGGALLQLVWVGWLWHWKQLPGGGDYPP